MNTTSTDTIERRQEAELRLQELPQLAPADRLALTLGLRLLLWEERRSERRAEQSGRIEQMRRTRADRHADGAARAAFEHRAWAGPTW